MRKTTWMTVLAALAVTLAGCGGGGDDAFEGPGNPDPGTPGNPGTPAAVATVTLLTSSPTIPSDNSQVAELSAYVRDANNNFLENVLVEFNADSGGLHIVQAVTDANGLARASLRPLDDPSLRTITVTATAGGVSDTVTVNVTGTRITLQGPTSLVLGQEAEYTAILRNAANDGIPGKELTVSSSAGNQLSATTLTTDSSGRATFRLTASAGGNDTITVSGLGTSATATLAVNSDSFAFTSPAANTEVPLGTAQTITVRWLQNGVPVNGQPVTFSTTRGMITSANPVNTNANGEATVTVQSNNAGGAVITAQAAGGGTTQLPIEFVATAPASIDVQPSAFTIGTEETSVITAVVRDADNNLVKNQTVVFTLEDTTGGSISVGSAVTDSLGRAETVYTASSITSGANAVRITATVQGTSISDFVELTVARREVFISLGTGNEIEEPNPAQYRITYAVQVTDANGNGVANVPVVLSVLSEAYIKGKRVEDTDTGDGWETEVKAVCQDEDTLIPGPSFRNGQLDPGEDFNNSGRLEAGNIATVAPANATTDENGFVLVTVTYPQDHAEYVIVVLEARASVQGTEYARASRFILPISADDMDDLGVTPPGPESPFGISENCADPF